MKVIIILLLALIAAAKALIVLGQLLKNKQKDKAPRYRQPLIKRIP